MEVVSASFFISSIVILIQKPTTVEKAVLKCRGIFIHWSISSLFCDKRTGHKTYTDLVKVEKEPRFTILRRNYKCHDNLLYSNCHSNFTNEKVGSEITNHLSKITHAEDQDSMPVLRMQIWASRIRKSSLKWKQRTSAHLHKKIPRSKIPRGYLFME